MLLKSIRVCVETSLSVERSGCLI